MKKLQIMIRDTTYKAVMSFRETMAEYGHSLTMDETAELAFTALLKSFAEYLDKNLPRGQA